MTAISGVTVVDLTTIQAAVSGGTYESDPTTITKWAVNMLTDADQTEPTVANFVSPHTATKSSTTVVSLDLHPELTPGGKYQVVTTVVDGAGANLSTNKYAFTVSASLRATTSSFPVAPLEALYLAFGETMDYYAGRPETLLVNPVQSGSVDAIYVESTLAFPWKGAVWVGGMRVSYENKTDGAFLNLTWDEAQQPGFGVRSKVRLDSASVPASDTMTLGYGSPDWAHWQDMIDYES